MTLCKLRLFAVGVGVAVGCATAVSCAGSIATTDAAGRGGGGGPGVSSGQTGDAGIARSADAASSDAAVGDSGMPARCSLPAVGGTCQASFPSYFHSAKNGVCQPFVYGGCDGNDNRFETLEECQEECHGGTPDMDACATSSDCVLVSSRCCPCDFDSRYRHVAINARHAQVYEGWKRPCPEAACRYCSQVDAGEQSRRFFAECRGGVCTVIDVRGPRGGS